MNELDEEGQKATVDREAGDFDDFNHRHSATPGVTHVGDSSSHFRFSVGDLIPILVPTFLIVFFTILFFCSFFIPRSEYLEAKKQNPELDFFEMPTTPLAIYWTYYCIIIIFLITIPLNVYFFTISTPWIILSILPFFAIATFIFALVSPIEISDIEIVDNAFSHNFAQSYASYESGINDMINQLPYLEVGFTGTSVQTGKVKTYFNCYPPVVRTYAINATTTYSLPKLGNYSWVYTKLNATYSEEVLEYLNRFRELYRKHLPTFDQNGREITWTDISGYKMKTYNPDIVLIKRKELSGKLSPAVGKTMITFWAGLGYVYRLMAIPIYHSVVTKANIVINITVDDVPKEGDLFYYTLDSIKCG
ncbi:hypothetical protein GPJ56_002524 [Histomonas meleagridis]|uniref:uncharacterized protein n=1 Tax=Histomonas meleagridis TaxID=135588 RepID=UPI00355A2013|nr:hypothetical protein GPJ56_002524 [Histomonas meleagridis]KAH0806013.1 hypothetical protein GO595_001174 [Histomonas meleagridis]